MVYIKLNQSLYKSLRQYIPSDSLVTCNKEYYVSYPLFKNIVNKQKMEIHKEVSRNDIITYHQMDLLIQKQRQTPEQRRLIQQLKNKRQLRLLGRINPQGKTEDYYFENKSENKGFRQLTDSVSFSMAFIFTFFMAGLTGYYVGAYFLGWNLVQSLMLSLGFIIITMIVETTLFILRQTKNQKKIKPKKYGQQYNKESKSPQSPSKNKAKKKSQ